MVPIERQVEAEEGKERAFDTVGLADALASEEGAPIDFVRRRRARDPLGWCQTWGHFAFVGFVVALSIGAPTLAAQIAVLGLALTYAALFAGSKSATDRHFEIGVDANGVRQAVNGQGVEIPWRSIESYVTPVMSLDAIGLRDATGRVVLPLGEGIGEGPGVVTNRLWRALARAVRARLPHDGSAADPEWRRRLVRGGFQLVLAFAGIGFTLATFVTRVGAKEGGVVAGLVALAAVSVLAIVAPVVIARAQRGHDATQGFVALQDETALDRFIEARRYRLDPVELEVGREYRYVEPKLLTQFLHGNPNQMLFYYPFMALGQVLRLMPDAFDYAAVVLIGAGGIFQLIRIRYRQALAGWTRARFSVEDGEVVAREGKREVRFPLATAETISLRSEWAELGGEATLFRQGGRMLVVDRRFLVADEPMERVDRK